MTNIEKAKMIKTLSERVQILEENLSDLEDRYKYFKEGRQAYIQVYCYKNGAIPVFIDDELFQHIIGFTQEQLNSMNEDLDNLLNGEANRLKEKFSVFADEIKECEGEE